MTSNAEKSESQRKILEEYVGKLERRLGSSEGKTKSASANRDVDQRALLDVVAELQEENGKLNDALQVGKKPGMYSCLLYTSPSPRDQRGSRMPSSA